MIASYPRDYPSKITDAARLFQDAETRLRQRELSDALSLYQAAEQAGYEPDACGGARWICHMLRGDFAAAWRESDVIDRRGQHDPNRFWTGAPLEGKRVLVRCLHGLGDTIQFIRYAPLLRGATQHLTVEAQPVLKALIAAANVADHVMTWGEQEPPYDEQIEIIELPRIFGTTLPTVPGAVPYLAVPNDGQRRPPGKSAGKARIGIVWASSRFNTSRSIPFETLETLIRSRPDLKFCSFQADPERQDLSHSPLPIADFFDESASVITAAQRLLSVDLFLTVDTMMAHLAGALAVPVWTMLPFEADWRWMLERSDSPWYPTMTLFRQPSPGDWDAVAHRVSAALALRFPRR